MPTRNVVLTTHQEAAIQRLVASGRYQNASEVLREGLRLVETHEAEISVRLQALKVAAEVGIDAMERGAFKEFPTADAMANYLAGATDDILDPKID